MKKTLCLFCTLLALTVAGCDNSKKTETKPETPNAAAQSKAPGKITVVSGTASKDDVAANKFRTYDLRGESIIKYAPEGAEITPEVKNVQVNVAVRNTPYAQIQARLLSQRLSKDFIVFCSACHDDYANGVIGPSLINKNEKEVLDMMVKYHEDPNANVLMTTLVERMTPEEKAFIARDIARFNYEYHNSKSENSTKDDEFKSKYSKE